jgi:hypothetical protein
MGCIGAPAVSGLNRQDFFGQYRPKGFRQHRSKPAAHLPSPALADGNTVRSFPTHGQQPAAQGSSTTVSRSDIRLTQHLDSSAHGLVRRWLLIGYFPILYNPHPLAVSALNQGGWEAVVLPVLTGAGGACAGTSLAI